MTSNVAFCNLMRVIKRPLKTNLPHGGTGLRDLANVSLIKKGQILISYGDLGPEGWRPNGDDTVRTSCGDGGIGQKAIDFLEFQFGSVGHGL